MNKVKTGVSKICITPPLGTAISGYYSPRYTEGVHDDIPESAFLFTGTIDEVVAKAKGVKA